MKKAMVYSPYWDTLGGGEKYCAAVAEVLMQLGYKVTIAWNDDRLITKLVDRFDIDLTQARIDNEAFLDITTGNFWHKKRSMWSYDLVFFVSDGSLPFLFGQKKNLLHFQVPFHDVGGKSVVNRLKKMTIDQVVCNSRFTKKIVDAEYGFFSQVLHPPATMIEPGKKEKVILSVGRFDNLMQSKRQDVMIEAFGELQAQEWKLVLAGGVLHGNDEVERLKRMIGNLNIILVTNPSWEEMKQHFQSASIYWHAAGYDVDLDQFPEQAEHFGISVVEAMSAEAVPVVFNGGGLREIVNSGKNGFLWKTQADLVKYTLQLIKSSKLMKKMSEAAAAQSLNYSMEEFERGFKKLIS